jgi:hypothetical protein
VLSGKVFAEPGELTWDNIRPYQAGPWGLGTDAAWLPETLGKTLKSPLPFKGRGRNSLWPNMSPETVCTV